MRHFLLITLFLFGATSIYAQQNFPDAKKGSVQGKIVDQISKQPIEFATISLHLKSDSSIVTGTTADKTGNFELKDLENGSYFIRTGFVGYKSTYRNNILISTENKNVDLGLIALASSMESLAEVQVTAEKRQMETMIDKKIFNVDKTPAAAGGDGLEVLRNVPTIEVDVDGNISMRGESNVNILVDGRPLNMSAAQYLQSVPASSIQKIELITNPSAKYDPEGTSGIINIIMKKDRAGGLNGSINSSLGYGQHPKSNNSLSVNYRNKKWNLQSSIGANYRKSQWGGTNDRNIFLGDTSFYQTTRDVGIDKNLNLSGKLGADYYLNDKTTLYVSGNIINTTGEGNRTMFYENYDGDRNLVNNSDRQATNDYPFNAYTLNGGFQHKIDDKGNNLDLDMNYSVNDGYTDERFSQQFIDENGEQFAPPTEQIQKNSNYNSVFNSRLDYVKPLNDSSVFEAGFHTTLRDFDNSLFLATENENGEIIPADSLNNQFLYGEEVYALYSTISREFAKWTLKGGLRYEHTGTNGKLVNTNESAGLIYNSLFPSAYVSYKLSQAKNVQVSYTRRINRPREGQLNPFTSYSDPYTIRTGNPFLRPEYIDVYELGYNSYGKKLNINASVYMRQVNDRIGRFIQLNEETGTNTVLFKNFDKSQVLGAEMILSYNPAKWMRTTTSFNYWHSKIGREGFIEENLNYSNYGYSLFFQSTHNINKDWMFQWSIQHRGKMKVLQGNITAMNGVDLSARKRILEGKGSLSLRVSDVFNTRQFGFTSIDLENYTYETLRNWESQTVYVSFSYSFGQQDNNRRRRRNNFDNGGGGNVPATGL